MEKNVENFLMELTKLTKTYGIIIGGCGCCGSPYLISVEDETSIAGFAYDNLTYEKEKGYSIENIYPMEEGETECTQ